MFNIRFVFSLSLLFASLTVSAQQTPLYKIFLVGDAGDDEMTNQTLDSLGSQLKNNPNSAVIFLGDNSYRNALWGLFPYGYKGFDSSRVTQKKVMSQLDILKNYYGAAYFVPGNHDWWNIIKFRKGRRKLKMEENFIEQNLQKNITIQNPNNTFLPKNGTPGPATVELNNGKIKVIFIDTYWLILLGFKKTPVENYSLATAFYHNLDSLLADATSKKQKILVVAHHPVYSVGFGKNRKHLLLPLRMKQSFPSFPSYTKMSAQINDILKKYPGAYYASGHLHAMQYHFTRDSIHYIISGAGSKIYHVPVRDAKKAKPNSVTEISFRNDKGFFELDFYNNRENIMIYHDEGKKKCDVSVPGDIN